MTKWIAYAIAAVGITAGIWFGRQAAEQGKAARLAAEDWKRRESELVARIRALEQPVPASPVEGPPAPPPAPKAKVAKLMVDDPVTRQELIRQVNERNERLAAAESSLTEAQQRMREAESRITSLTEEAQRLNTSERGLQERLDAAVKLAESLQNESRTREAQLAQVEANSQELKRRGTDATQKATRLAKLSDEMEDLIRRQDVFLNGILRRYREVADLYRTISLRRETSREGPVGSNSDISRIQTALSAADEDIRQLRSLQAQQTRLQKEFSAARR